MSVNLYEQLGDSGFALEGVTRVPCESLTEHAREYLAHVYNDRITFHDDAPAAPGDAYGAITMSVDVAAWGEFKVVIHFSSNNGMCSFYSPFFLPRHEIDESDVFELASFLDRMRIALRADYVEITLDDLGDGLLRNYWLGVYDGDVFCRWFNSHSVDWEPIGNSAFVEVRRINELGEVQPIPSGDLVQISEAYEKFLRQWRNAPA